MKNLHLRMKPYHPTPASFLKNPCVFAFGRAVLVWMVLLLSLGMLSGCGGIVVDRTPPSSPLLSVGTPNTGSVRLVWSGAYDDTGIDTYQVYRDGTRIAMVNKTEYTDRTVSAGQSYTYEVVAVDRAGNRSDPSAPGYADIPAAGAEGTGAAGTGTASGADGMQGDGVGSGSGTAGNTVGAGGRVDIQTLSRSTVKVYIIDDDYNIVGTGSGTILNQDGDILTNAHVVETDDGFYNRDGFVGIALTDDVRVYSQPQYLARVMAEDADLDLAVVRLVSELDGTPLRTMPVLTPVAVGDADQLRLGDDINILGFPGVGGDTITFTSGRVAGFIDEDHDGQTDWIKTDALVNHGNSGGTAVDGSGRMVGIPTAKAGGEDNDQMYFLRPVNQAVQVIAAARINADAGGWAGAGAATGSVASGSPSGGLVTTPDAGNLVGISGTVVDAVTGRPVRGALFLMLSPGVPVDDWLAVQDDAEVISQGESDANGWFETLPAFPSGNAHGVIVWAEGYEMIALDEGITFTPDENGLYDIGTVSLTPVY